MTNVLTFQGLTRFLFCFSGVGEALDSAQGLLLVLHTCLQGLFLVVVKVEAQVVPGIKPVLLIGKTSPLTSVLLYYLFSPCMDSDMTNISGTQLYRIIKQTTNRIIPKKLVFRT